MSDWYVSSAAYASVAAWAATTAYTVGQFVKRVTSTQTTSHVFRCTTSGTSAASEPGWSAGNNTTTASGGAVFTNVSGQSTYGWAAAAGTLSTLIDSGISGRTVPGDRVFISSDHAESNGGNYSQNNGSNAYGLVQHISVNRAGSVPPVTADIQSGAAITVPNTGTLVLEAYTDVYWQGISFILAAGGSPRSILFASNGSKAHYFKDCTFAILNTGANSALSTSNAVKVTFDNCTFQFGATTQGFFVSSDVLDFIWLNTPSAIQGATLPANLFQTGNLPFTITCRGVDLSAITGNIISASTNSYCKVLLDSCKIASGVTRFAGTPTYSADEVELVNCFDGTNYFNERYTSAGIVTTDRSTTLSGGAQDDVGAYSLKLVSNTRADKFTMPLESFWLDIENTLIGASKTATVEIISSASLNNDDIQLMLEYMGTTGSAVASFVDSLASVLTAAAALSSSSAIWTTPSLITLDTATTFETTLTNGNLTAMRTTYSGSQYGGAHSVNYQSTGKYYFEVTIGTNNNTTTLGILSSTGTYQNFTSDATNSSYINGLSGGIFSNNANTSKSVSAFTVGAVYGVAIDLTARKAWFRKNAGDWNGELIGISNPATGTGGVTVGTGNFAPAIGFGNGSLSSSMTANFGQSAFAFTAPSGFGNWPNTTVSQLLQVTFLPRTAGRVRGLVRLGKVSTTVWVDPRITIT